MRIKLDMGIFGGEGSEKGNRPMVKNLAHLIRLIKSRGYNEHVENDLIQMAKKYPEGSLNFFWKNINKLSKISHNEKPKQVYKEEVTSYEIPEPKKIIKEEEPLIKRKPIFEYENNIEVPVELPPPKKPSKEEQNKMAILESEKILKEFLNKNFPDRDKENGTE